MKKLKASMSTGFFVFGRIFSDATQNMLFIEGLRWLVQANEKGDVFK